MDENSLQNFSFETNFLEKTVSELPSIESLVGKPLVVLLLNFGCPGCNYRAIPFMNDLFSKHQNEINFIGVHTNHEGVDFSIEEIKNFILKNKIEFPLYRDKNYNDFYYNYKAAGTPHWFIFNKDLKLNYSMFGSDPDRGLQKLYYIIDEILNH